MMPFPACREPGPRHTARLSRTGAGSRAVSTQPAAADAAGDGVVESILDGRAAVVTLPKLLEPFPWTGRNSHPHWIADSGRKLLAGLVAGVRGKRLWQACFLNAGKFYAEGLFVARAA